MLDVGFAQTRIFQRRGSLAEMQAGLQSIADYSRRVETRLSILITIVGAGFVLAALALVSLFAVLGWAEWNRVDGKAPEFVNRVASGLFIGMFACAAAAAVLGLVYCWYSSRKVDPRRLTVIRELLRHVGRDVRPDRALRVYVDFRSTTHAECLKSRRGPENRQHLRYSQRWLDLEGQMRDRTRFRLTIRQRLRRKVTEKRRSRDRDALFEQMSLVLTSRSPRPSLPFAPRLLKRLLAGRAKLTTAATQQNTFGATIETPVVLRDSHSPKPEESEPLFRRNDALSFFVSCFRVWRMVRRPVRS